MTIALTGATGFIGQALATSLHERGHETRILSRSRPPHIWSPLEGPPTASTLQGASAVIHLAGEPVAQRWTAAAKRRILESRITGTRHLVEGLRRLPSPPSTLISASAIGFYGNRGDETLNESSSPGAGFLPEVAQGWESEALEAEKLGVRVVCLRIGVVLDPSGGALAKMLTPFRLGLGGPIGSGSQWMSWIHRADLVRLILHSLDTPTLAGPVNAVAPHPVTNKDFSRHLGKALRRPAILSAPAFALRLALGEMATIVLDSTRVLPQAAQNSGFAFHFPHLDAALGDLL